MTTKQTARLAGFLYLIVVIAGIFSLLYVPSKLISWNDPENTLLNIQNSEQLFRWGIFAESLSFTSFLLLPLVLYKLLNHISKTYAVAMVALAIPSVPIFFSNLLNKFAILSMAGVTGTKAAAFENIPEQLMFYLQQFNDGNLIGQNFWALWLFPFGYLVYKSRMLPKILGLFLMVGSAGYYLDFIGRILLPQYGEMGISDYMTLPASIGEIGTCLWLLIMGAKERKAIASPQ